jgi:hypothetical protein
MAFTATEGTTAPIVLGKEPVKKPADIIRGKATTFMACVVSHDEEKQRVTFRSRYSGFAVTYHDVPVQRWRGDIIDVEVTPAIVVTWDEISVSN